MKRTREEFMKWFHKERWNIDYRNGKRDEWERNAWLEWVNELEAGDHAHICHWSDVSPVTVIKRTAKTITVRYDKAELDPNWKPEFVVGGFSAHCTNNDDQQWIITEDLNGRTETFRLRQVGWRNKSDEKLYPEWMKKYDYNF